MRCGFSPKFFDHLSLVSHAICWHLCSPVISVDKYSHSVPPLCRLCGAIRVASCVNVSQQYPKETLSRGKERKSIYKGAIYILCISQSDQAWITQFYLQIHHTCLSFLSVHQMAPPLTEVGDIQLQLTTHLSTSKRLKAGLAWLVDL